MIQFLSELIPTTVPQRIISLLPSRTELLYDLGLANTSNPQLIKTLQV